MSKIKAERAGSDIQRELGNILLLEAKDKDFKNVTITAVDVSSDFSYAKVYVSFLTSKHPETNLEELNKCKGFVRSSLAKKIDIRKTPEITFYLDETYEKVNRLDEILKKESQQIEIMKKE